jgi:hypothetical protein
MLQSHYRRSSLLFVTSLQTAVGVRVAMFGLSLVGHDRSLPAAALAAWPWLLSSALRSLLLTSEVPSQSCCAQEYKSRSDALSQSCRFTSNSGWRRYHKAVGHKNTIRGHRQKKKWTIVKAEPSNQLALKHSKYYACTFHKISAKQARIVRRGFPKECACHHQQNHHHNEHLVQQCHCWRTIQE